MRVLFRNSGKCERDSCGEPLERDCWKVLAQHLHFIDDCGLQLSDRNYSSQGNLMRTFRVILLAAVCCFCGSLRSEEATISLDLFDAMDAGQVGVKFIAVDEARANVLVENLTELPLVIQLPNAIAAVPVLAQFGQGPGQGFGQGFGQGNGQNGGQNGGGGGSQPVGGNVNAGQGQGLGQGLGLGMGFMRIPPRKQLKLVASTVCLDHGIAEPNPRVAYRMIRLSEFTDNELLAKLCSEIGSSELSQKAAQAIAWHLANGMNWDELTKVNSIESKYLGNVSYFKARDIKMAKQWMATASELEASGSSSSAVSAR